MYRAETVANFFIGKGLESGRPVTNLKLQKLVYFAHGWYLALTDKPLIDSTIEAWRFGPVVNSLYHGLKEYGMNPITSKLSLFPYNSDRISSIDTEFLDFIWELYKDFSAEQLVNFTHEAGSPWSDIIVSNGGINSIRRGVDIPDENIKTYFKSIQSAAK